MKSITDVKHKLLDMWEKSTSQHRKITSIGTLPMPSPHQLGYELAVVEMLRFLEDV